MNALGALPVLFAPLCVCAPLWAWAGMAEDAERAAERILLEEKVLNVYFVGSEQGRLTILFGKQIAGWQIESILKRFNNEPAIRGVTHTRVDTDYCPIQ